MKNKRVLIGGLLVVLWLLGLSQVWAYPVISDDEPSDAQVLRNLLTSPDCIRACYLGIQPMKTSIENALAILSENGIPYETSQIVGNFYKYYWESDGLPFQNPNLRFSLSSDEMNDMVAELKVPIRTSGSLILEAFGSPDHIYIDEGFPSHYYFIYTARGLYFSFAEADHTYEATLIDIYDLDYQTSGSQRNWADQPCASYGVAPCIAPTATPIFVPTQP